MCEVLLFSSFGISNNLKERHSRLKVYDWFMGFALSNLDFDGIRCLLQIHTTGRLVLLRRKRRTWLTN